MKVIDAHTGREVKVGDRIPLPVSEPVDSGYIPGPHDTERAFRSGQHKDYYEVVSIEPGIFKATMVARFYQGGALAVQRIPLQVRWTHPGFFFQHVAFVPS